MLPLARCSDLDSQSLKLPVSKTSLLSTHDYHNLKAIYAVIYQHAISEAQMTQSIKTFKSITLYG